MTDLDIRETTPVEENEVLALYPLAFPDEELRPVVTALLPLGPKVLSLLAFDGATAVGHVLFTLCGTGRADHDGALLGPLGVVPGYQRQGWGGALVRSGLNRLSAMGVKQVFVLGDPGYYRRFGFLPERHVLPPYPLPQDWADAWQSQTLAHRDPLESGPLHLPAPWMDPALWRP